MKRKQGFKDAIFIIYHFDGKMRNKLVRSLKDRPELQDLAKYIIEDPVRAISRLEDSGKWEWKPRVGDMLFQCVLEIQETTNARNTSEILDDLSQVIELRRIGLLERAEALNESLLERCTAEELVEVRLFAIRNKIAIGDQGVRGISSRTALLEEMKEVIQNLDRKRIVYSKAASYMEDLSLSYKAHRNNSLGLRELLSRQTSNHDKGLILNFILHDSLQDPQLWSEVDVSMLLLDVDIKKLRSSSPDTFLALSAYAHAYSILSGRDLGGSKDYLQISKNGYVNDPRRSFQHFSWFAPLQILKAIHREPYDLELLNQFEFYKFFWSKNRVWQHYLHLCEYEMNQGAYETALKHHDTAINLRSNQDPEMIYLRRDMRLVEVVLWYLIGEADVAFNKIQGVVDFVMADSKRNQQYFKVEKEIISTLRKSLKRNVKVDWNSLEQRIETLVKRDENEKKFLLVGFDWLTWLKNKNSASKIPH